MELYPQDLMHIYPIISKIHEIREIIGNNFIGMLTLYDYLGNEDVV